MKVILTLLIIFNSFAFDPLLKQLDWKKNDSNKKIKIALIDSGVNNQKNYIQEKVFNSHGTYLYHLIKLLTNDKVEIISLNYYNPDSKIRKSQYLQALQKAIELKVNIINLSNSGQGSNFDEFKLLKKAEQEGILLVSSIGNTKEKLYPASYNPDLKNMITVMPHKGYKLTEYKTFKADVSAQTAVPLVINNERIIKEGSSVSVAIVSALLATIIQKNNIKEPEKIISYLISHHTLETLYPDMAPYVTFYNKDSSHQHDSLNQ